MGLIFVTTEVKTTKRLLPTVIESEILMGKAQRAITHNDYDGSFAASKYYGNLCFLNWKGKTGANRAKQLSEYLEKKSDNMSMLENIIEAVAWDSLGYVAYKLGFIKEKDFEALNADGGKMLIARHYGEIVQEFSSKKTFLSWLKRASQRDLLELYGTYILDSEENVIGKIGMSEKRIYKTKPKKLPKKYATIEELYKIVYYGSCAF